jgi:hypothetical protein
MDHRAQEHSVLHHSEQSHAEGRGTWVLTVYAISGLALFGVLAYYVSSFMTN